MSLRATSSVWENSRAKGAGFTVMLLLADRQKERGPTHWPSVATIAKLCRLTDIKHTRKVLADLEAMGEIRIERTPGRASAYVLTPGSGTPSLYRPVVGGQNPPTTPVAEPPHHQGGKTPVVSSPYGGSAPLPTPVVSSPGVGGQNPPHPGGGTTPHYGYTGKDNGKRHETRACAHEAPRVRAEDADAALQAMNAWSQADRQVPLMAHRGEHRKLYAKLDELVDFESVPTPAGLVPAVALVPKAVEAKRAAGVVFKSIEFAMGCVRAQLSEWSLSGVPNGRPVTETYAERKLREAREDEAREKAS